MNDLGLINVNQKLYSKKYGWGIVEDIDTVGDKYTYSPISIRFLDKDYQIYYNYYGQEDLSYKDGKHYECENRFLEDQDLFLDEVVNNKKLKSIDIVLENCEVFNIPIECISYFYFYGFNKSLYFHAPNDVLEHNFVEYAQIHLKNINKISGSTMLGHEIGECIESRLKQYNDITQIHLNYNYGKSFWFCVPWNEDNEYDNKYQDVKIKNDEICIIISRDKIN